VTQFRALPEVDQLMALAMRLYEDGQDHACGQQRSLAMDPDLAEEWTWVEPSRCYACTMLANAAEASKDRDHPHALRYAVGLREGWEARKALKVQERANDLTGGDTGG
jgi:hypothetical protein